MIWGNGKFPAVCLRKPGKIKLLVGKPLFLEVHVDKGDGADGSIDHCRHVKEQASVPCLGDTAEDSPELTDIRGVEQHETESYY